MKGYCWELRCWKVTWWARQIRSRSWFFKKSFTMSAPKTYETPLSDSSQLRTSYSGSDHRRSHIRPILKIILFVKISLPESGTSVGLTILFICSISDKSGDRPPCMQNILSSIIAHTGKQLKQSVNSFQSLILYLLLPKRFYKLRNQIKSITFIIKSVYSINWCALMISSQQKKVFGIFNFVGE